MHKCYVAAPFGRAAEANGIALTLRDNGIHVTSRWIGQALRAEGGKETLTQESAAAAIRQNDADVVSSDSVLALYYPGEGREFFCEVRFALSLFKRVVWLGDPGMLTAWRPGVTVVSSAACSTVDILSALKGGDSGCLS
jgi:hypothetical protein